MNKYNIGDQVRIKGSKELKELRDIGGDITEEMIECGSRIVTISYVVPNYLWLCSTLPEYRVEEIPEWTWYENLLEPIEE